MKIMVRRLIYLKNLINSKDNKELFLNLIVEKIVRDNKFGLRLVTE